MEKIDEFTNFQNNIVPRVAAIHDLSGYGRCSLSVIIPVLSVMGIQVCPIPTAILSTHTGGFTNIHFTDFTENIQGYADHWDDLGINFDNIYTGFLGSAKQIDIVLSIFTQFKKHSSPLILVDPVMGDHGELYSTYTPEMQNKMRMLVEKADIITPNLTEAYFLLEREYTDKGLSTCEMKDLLMSLSNCGPEKVVITGVKTDVENFVNIGYSKSINTFWKVSYENIPVQYPGTGDIFASVLIGSILSGNSLPEAMSKAAKFISLAVKTTFRYSTPQREGVLLEKVLHTLNNIELTPHSYENL